MSFLAVFRYKVVNELSYSKSLLPTKLLHLNISYGLQMILLAMLMPKIRKNIKIFIRQLCLIISVYSRFNFVPVDVVSFKLTKI